MNEIKISEVAAMLGKKIGEEFKVKDLKSGEIYVAYFDGRGMKAHIDGSSDSWKPRRDIVRRLVVGTAVVIDD